MANVTYKEVRKSGECVTLYEVNERNGKNERMLFEIVHCTNPGGNNSLPYLWNKNGFTDGILETYVSINTYVHDSEGNCYGMYNPQSKRSDDGKRNVINFDWMFEDTEENRQKLIDETIRLFMSAEGKSATEIKMEKVMEFAKEKGLEIVNKIPDGWFDRAALSTPRGCTIVANHKFPYRGVNGKPIKYEDYEERLLVF